MAHMSPRMSQNGTPITFFVTVAVQLLRYPWPPCASTALSKHAVGVEPLFEGIFGTSVFVVPHVRRGLKHRTLQANGVCFDVILNHSCCSPSTAYHHLPLRALPDVGGHVRSGTVLSKHSLVLNRCFACFFFGTVAMLAQGEGGGYVGDAYTYTGMH